jgi:hypothetical protein
MRTSRVSVTRIGRYAVVVASVPVLLLLAPPLAGASRAGDAMHSGTITTVDLKHDKIVLEEVGPWTPKHPGIVRRAIEVTPVTHLELAARSQTSGPQHWPGTFAEQPLQPSGLRPGEFATVKTADDHGRLVAKAITVVTVDKEGQR